MQSQFTHSLIHILRPFINLLLYGHFWIAAAALLMTAQTKYFLQGSWQLDKYEWFVASGTLAIYALHRMVALFLHPSSSDNQERYVVLQKFRWHIILYAFLSGLCSIVLYFSLPTSIKLWLIAPCGIALAYVLPLVNGRRLRDLPFLKIFLIAVSWAWITVAIPFIIADESFSTPFYWMMLERICFIFAITIPFDIRDMVLDKKNQVTTLPGFVGEDKARRGALYLLLLMLFAVIGNVYTGTYSWVHFIAFLLSLSTTTWLVWRSRSNHHDYYFSGLLDGTMVFQAMFLIAFQFLGV